MYRKCCMPCKCQCPPCRTAARVRVSVVYLPNGGSGGLTDENIVLGALYTIKNAQSAAVSLPGYELVSWNTQPDGTGDTYTPGEVITISGGLRLYAQWALPEATVNLVYEPNLAGSGGLVVTAPQGSTAEVAGSGIVSAGGREFVEWNTLPNGGGQSYAPGAQIVLDANTVLYARWRSYAPSVEDVYELDVQINGAGVYHSGGESVINITFPNGATASATVGSNGLWSVAVPASEQPLAYGTQIAVTQTELNMLPSNTVNVTVAQ